jgi:hypothetical protein
MGRVLGCVQPSYLAWIPFFERMKISSVFIYLDDVKYSKNSFHNRNRIMTPQGPLLLTVPVLYTGNSNTYISQIKIDYRHKWAKKHWRSIEQNYRKAIYFDQLSEGIKNILYFQWDTLADLNIELINYFKNYLGIKTPCHRSSQIPVEGKANEKLVNICRYFGADHFIVKQNTEDYHPEDYFNERGIEFTYFTTQKIRYAQLSDVFEDGLSILDYAMNCGPKGI